MFRLVLYMAVLGAMLRVAKSDFKCFQKKLKNLKVNLDQISFGGSDDAICQSPDKELINPLQHAIDECSVPVTTDDMKSLLEEICQPGSELHQTFKESGICLHLNDDLGADCKDRVDMDPSLSTKQACLKLKQDYLTCTAETKGGPCGEKAVKALKRLYKMTDSLTNGLCDELVSSGSWSLVSRHLHWVAIAVVGLIAVIV